MNKNDMKLNSPNMNSEEKNIFTPQTTSDTQEDRIPVLFLCSEEFSKYLAVSMVSLLDNKCPSTYYEIYVMTSKRYSAQSMKPFDLMQERYDKFSISWIEMDDAFEDTQKTPSGVGKETYYRLLAAERLPNVNRCIYLDSDTIVLDDLTEMFHFDTRDAYICGIHPIWFLSKMTSDYKKTYGNAAHKMMEKAMGLASYDEYIGAGVMIMNLGLIRHDQMTEKFLKRIKPHSMPVDQDILNTCCYGHIAHLPVKYCVDLHEHNDLDWFAENDEDEFIKIQHALLHPVVVHFSDKYKPWNMLGLRYEREWWRYAYSIGLFDLVWDTFLDAVEKSANIGQVNILPAPAGVDTSAIYEAARAQFCKSISYRIGRFITYIPRKIYYFFVGLGRRK